MPDKPIDQALIRVVDDDRDFLEGLCFLLDAKGWKTVGYRSAQSFLTSEPQACPDA